MVEEREYTRIEKRVEEKLGFYLHLATYFVVNLFLISLNVIVSPGSYWFFWPLLGWGMGLILHALAVFVFGGGSEIRRRMIDDEMLKAGLKQ